MLDVLHSELSKRNRYRRIDDTKGLSDKPLSRMVIELKPCDFINVIQMGMENKAVRPLFHGYDRAQADSPSPALRITRYHESVSSVDIQEVKRLPRAAQKRRKVVEVERRLIDPGIHTLIVIQGHLEYEGMEGIEHTVSIYQARNFSESPLRQLYHS